MRRTIALLGLVFITAAGGVAGTARASSPPSAEVKVAGLDSRLARIAALTDDGRSGSEVIVLITPAMTGDSLSDLIERLAGEVVVARSGGVLASVPADRLVELAGSDRVSFVGVPAEPVEEAIVGEGAAGHEALSWHAAGFDGTGVRVMVLDAGFADYAAAQAMGDVPAPALVVTGPTCRSPAFAGTSHGTAVAEIVHDMAPGAAIYLYKTCTLSEGPFVADLVAQHDIDVVTESLGFFNTVPLDGRDPTGQFAWVDSIRDEGAAFVNSAGNYRERHWSGMWEGGSRLEFEGLPYLESTLGRGTQVFLRWDDWRLDVGSCVDCGSDLDLDLYLLDTSGAVVASSTTPQSPGSPAPPVEQVFVNAPGTYRVEVRAAVPGPIPPDMRLDLFFPSTDLPRALQVPEGSLNDPATLPVTLAVGAACVFDDVIRDFSSQGPTGAGAIKPDVTGYDGVSTTVSGVSSTCRDGFIGTSAGAPHIAGALALLIQAFGFTGDEAVAVLSMYTEDHGDPGPDNRYGSGIVKLGPPPVGSCEGRAGTIFAPPGQVTVMGTDGADVIVGNDLSNEIYAGRGDDVVCALGGDDVVVGDRGRDRIHGGSGSDSLDGGSGKDRVAGDGGADIVDGGDHSDRVRGDGGDDRLSGALGGDRVRGGWGDDLVTGGVGDDRLWGGRDDDQVEGGSGDDLLDGGDDTDLLNGGIGTDTCTNGTVNTACEVIV